jgi:hypothetical protein
MQRKIIGFGGPLFLLVLAGCAAHTEYTKPKTQPEAEQARPVAPGTVVVDRPRDVVWRQLLANAAKSNFSVSEVNPKTWTVQLRYTGDPKDYIDCGRVRSPVKTAKGEKIYEFSAAKAYQQYQLQSGGRLYVVDRRMNIDVRATVNLEAVGQTRTHGSLAARYSVTRDQSVTGSGKPFAVTDTVKFSGRETATFPNAPTNCHATGRLEDELLALLKQEPAH